MAKTKKYTLEYIIFNKDAIARIHEDKDLMRFVDERDGMIRLQKTGMTSIEFLKNLVFFNAALTITCCGIDEKGNPDNWNFSHHLAEVIADLHFAVDDISGNGFVGKAFDEWFQKNIENCIDRDKEVNSDDDFNATHRRIILAGDYNTKNVNVLVGYDWED